MKLAHIVAEIFPDKARSLFWLRSPLARVGQGELTSYIEVKKDIDECFGQRSLWENDK